MKISVALAILTMLALSARAQEPVGIFARPRVLARELPLAYQDICKSYYASGHYARTLTAALDLRDDGTPNIVLDRQKGSAEFTVRLSVNERAYAEWKNEATKRLAALNLSTRHDLSSFERCKSLYVAGSEYALGVNERNAFSSVSDALRAPEGHVSVRVQLLNDKGQSRRTVTLKLSDFGRLGFANYPLPLHHLNRLKDLPVSVFPWFNGERDNPKSDTRLEDAYAKFTLTNFTDEELSEIVDMKCEVLQSR